MEPEIKLESINIDDVLDGATNLVSTGAVGGLPMINSKTGLIVVGAVGAGIAIGATAAYMIPKVQKKLPEPGVLHRRNKVVDVDDDELKEVKGKKKSKKKKTSKEKEEEDEEK